MAITFESVIQQILNVLGAVKGSTPATAEAAYVATPSISTVIGPDFLASQVSDALAATLSELVEAIASTPLHPERARYADITAPLANRAAIPRTGASGDTIIGVPGFVRDAVDSQACLPAALDAVRSYNRFVLTIYADLDPYLYAFNGNRIEHTRTNVVVEVCVWERPTVFTGDMPVDEWHEGGLVQGAVAKLALKESMFSSLYEGANFAWAAHLAQVRGYKDPALYGKATAAPVST